jgi:hypothetical protein
MRQVTVLFRMRLYGGAGGPRLPLFCPPGVLEFGGDVLAAEEDLVVRLER